MAKTKYLKCRMCGYEEVPGLEPEEYYYVNKEQCPKCIKKLDNKKKK